MKKSLLILFSFSFYLHGLRIILHQVLIPVMSLLADPNSTWTHVLVAATIADGASSQAAQTYTMNVTSLPAGGANVRVYKTISNGNDFLEIL